MYIKKRLSSNCILFFLFLKKVDPNFQYGVTQACFSLVLLTLSFFTTIISLIIGQRSTRPSERENSSEDDPSRHLLSSQDGNTSTIINSETIEVVEDVEDILIASTDNAGCSSNCRARTGAGRYRCDSEVNIIPKDVS